MTKSFLVTSTGPTENSWARLDRIVGERAAAIAEEVEDDVAEEDREADRHDHHRNKAGAALAQRAPQPEVHSGAHHRPGTDGERCGDEQLDAELDVEPPREHGTERDHLGVGEVDQPGRAVDQREPDRAHADDQAELDPLVRQTSDAFPQWGGGRPGLRHGGRRLFGEVEQQRSRLVRAQLEEELLAAFSDDLHALGERLGRETSDVVPRRRQGEGIGAVGRRRHPADLVAELDDLLAVLAERRRVHDDLAAFDGHLALLIRVVGGVLQRAPDPPAVLLLSPGGAALDEAERDAQERKQGERHQSDPPPPIRNHGGRTVVSGGYRCLVFPAAGLHDVDKTAAAAELGVAGVGWARRIGRVWSTSATVIDHSTVAPNTWMPTSSAGTSLKYWM